MLDVVSTTIYEFRSALVAMNATLVDFLPVYRDFEEPKTFNTVFRNEIENILATYLEPMLDHHLKQIDKMVRSMHHLTGKDYKNVPDHVSQEMKHFEKKDKVTAHENAGSTKIVKRILKRSKRKVIEQPVKFVFDILQSKVKHELEILFKEGKDIERKLRKFFVWAYTNQMPIQNIADIEDDWNDVQD